MGTDRAFSIQGLPHQLELWKEGRQDIRVAMVGPLGSGKTYGLAVKALLLSKQNEGFDGLLVVPTYNLFRMVHLEEWPTIWASLGVAAEWNASDSAWTMPWGSKLWVRSAEAPKRLAGPNLAFVVFDEPGQMPREAWDRGSIRARHVGAKFRQVVLGGTPEGINWFADLFAVPQGAYRTIWARSWHPAMAHYPDQLAATYGYDESLLDTYLGGKFVPLRVGRAWRFFDDAKHVTENWLPLYEPTHPLILACDFNVDAMRWEVGQIDAASIRWFDEIALGQGGSTQEAAREFVRRWGVGGTRIHHRGSVTITGDASGTARSTSGPTDYQVLEEELKPAFTYGVRRLTPKANPLVKDRVASTNYHLAGRGRSVTAASRCKELVRDWRACAWRPGTSELDKSDPLRTHAAEAADYATWMLARVAPKRGGGHLPEASMDANESRAEW